METKTIFIWILSIFGVLATAAIVILAMKNKKLKGMSIEDVLKKYVDSLPVYANNADALTNGLKAGDKYRTSSTATMYSIVTN